MKLRSRSRREAANNTSARDNVAAVPEEAAPPADVTEEDWNRVHLYKNNDNQFVSDITVRFLYYPHTITACVICGILLIYFALDDNPDAEVANLQEGLRRGVSAASLFVLVLAALVFPSGPFIRPHPIVWRITFGLGVLYELWLIVIVFQNKATARYLMTFLHDDLNQPLDEREYAADCSLSANNLWAAFADRYFLAHFLGWICKTIILRDRLLCWTISITWELVEIGFTHMLPNFAECWWDQWLMDVCLANAAGIYIGRKLCDYLELRSYAWKGVLEYPTVRGKVERLLLQFTPAKWMPVRWNKFATIKRFLLVNTVVVCFHISELNAFFLKHILWIAPENPLNLIRLIISFMVGLPAWRQLYVYATDPACKRIGNHSFLCISTVCTEAVIIFKFGRGEFHNEMPNNVYMFTLGALISYLLLAVAIMVNIYKRNRSNQSSDVGALTLDQFN